MKTAELALNHNDPLMNKVPKICFALAGRDIMLECKSNAFQSYSMWQSEHLKFMRSSDTERIQ